MCKKRIFPLFLIVILAFWMLFLLAGAALADSASASPTDPLEATLEVDNITKAVTTTILEIMATAAITAIGIAGAWLTAKIGQGKHLDNIATATDLLTSATQQTVEQLNQTIVERYRSEAKNGKLTKEQITQLGNELFYWTKRKLSSPVVNLLETAKTDVNAAIEGAAQSYIGSLKQLPTPPLEEILTEYREQKEAQGDE